MIHNRQREKNTNPEGRLRLMAAFFLLVAALIIARLFMLQVIEHDYYALFAENSHEIQKKIQAHRGAIYWQDTRTGHEFPAAINRDYYLVYAVPRAIASADIATTTEKLMALLGTTADSDRQNIATRLSLPKSYYAPLFKKVSSTLAAAIKEASLPGIYTTPQEHRFYPEANLGGNVLGFVGSDISGNLVGRYGLEQYWEQKIAGRGGFVAGVKGALGSWINLSDRTLIAPVNGADLVLTIDRTLEHMACARLAQGLKDYQAKSAALILMNPKTGAILAMCSLPDFDPNQYSATADQAAFNNTNVFTLYEPGSVFKPFSLGAALDLGLVTPHTTFTDPCQRVINGYTIRNADKKCYGLQTMTGVLENSINTGMIWVAEKLGHSRLKDYVEKFGFGKRTGVALAGEVAGDVSSLEKKGAIFAAVGSFGQGLTVTPLQLATAYAAIANGGKLPKPYIVAEARYANGKKETTVPETTEQALSPHAAQMLSAMLTSVVENHYTRAKIPGYYVAGKTGTAQIPGPGGYTEDTNHTFAGFAPATSPELVLLVKFEKPKQRWAEQTALYVFKDVLEFALEYYDSPHDKK